MKSSRLLSMLLLLQGAERRSARELAEALEVSERTVYRDVDALSAAGVPIYTERGSLGGIALSEGYRKALTSFDDDEIRSLFISGNNPLVDLGLGIERERALQKLSGAMNDVQRKAAAKSRGRIHLDQRRWNQSEQPQEFLALLRRAVWEDRCANLHYRDREAKVTQRVIDPMGLVAKAGIWYLVARHGTEYRTFRAERIVDVQILDQGFTRPADFDLDLFWQQWTANVESQDNKFSVVLKAAASSLEDLSRYWETHLMTQDDANTITLRVVFTGRDVAIHQLVAWGHIAQIVEPQELADDIVARAQAVLAHLTKK